MKMTNSKRYMFGFVILLSLCPTVIAEHGAGCQQSDDRKALPVVEDCLPTDINLTRLQAFGNIFHVKRFVRQQQPAPPGSETYPLKEGTEVSLKFAQDLSSKTAAEDDRVNFELAEDLKVGDLIVAKAGSKAVGTVTHVKKSGMFGKGGELNVRLEYLKVGDSRIRLRGNKGKEGESKTGTAIVLTVLFGPIGLIKKGKNVEVKSGAPIKAFVDEDIRLPIDNQPVGERRLLLRLRKQP